MRVERRSSGDFSVVTEQGTSAEGSETTGEESEN